ncbi:tyrosine-type recombinase/integrase [Clostridium transplantifaecale]|uniref:tyrosine-type recombinase/integrase n=1 Tax=Clostridium transplantifaecale TaxID=2479838 RepID=UPI000F636F9B|nr:tyrosine-type recombinase/integrase [Clostridium transplantifaecale]
MDKIIKLENIKRYERKLYEEEKSKLTIEKYIRDIMHFYRFLPQGKRVNKEQSIAYKQYLKEHYRVSSANSMLVALNRFFEYMGWNDFKVQQFKIQKTFFCRNDSFMSKKEYERLIESAQRKGDLQLNLIMQTICSTGIRISELSAIDVKAVAAGYAYVDNKGKSRVIFLPKALVRVLKTYLSKTGITSGPVFISSKGNAVDRSVVWRRMKRLCQDTGIDAKKVFPHNLRHLFALTFYRLKKDLLRLAEVLGHASIETTRIYTATTGEEHKRIISQLGLVRGWGGACSAT